MSFFLTVEDYPEFFERLEKMTGSKSGTGGGITFMDSGWEMSLVIYDRDYFPDQREKNRDVLWGDGLFGERIGSYIKKPMAECTGNEIIEEMLYHFGMLDMKDEVLAHSHISTCMMPYITSQFMPRKESDRPTIIRRTAQISLSLDNMLRFPVMWCSPLKPLSAHRWRQFTCLRVWIRKSSR